MVILSTTQKEYFEEYSVHKIYDLRLSPPIWGVKGLFVSLGGGGGGGEGWAPVGCFVGGGGGKKKTQKPP